MYMYRMYDGGKSVKRQKWVEMKNMKNNDVKRQTEIFLNFLKTDYFKMTRGTDIAYGWTHNMRYLVDYSIKGIFVTLLISDTLPLGLAQDTKPSTLLFWDDKNNVLTGEIEPTSNVVELGTIVDRDT